jgi:hypothetical protein
VSTERDFATQFAQPELASVLPAEPLAETPSVKAARHCDIELALAGYLPWERELIARNAYPPPMDFERDRALRWLTSGQARAAVLAAHSAAARRGLKLPWRREQWDYLNNTAGDNDNDRAYREWVRWKLRRSGLAQLLPGGRTMLPDIHEQLPGFWLSVERLLEPRTYPQLVQHVVKYLDWYLEPTPEAPPPLLQVFTAVPLLTLLLLFAPMLGFFSLLGLLPLLLLLRPLATRKRAHETRRVHNFYSAFSMINSAELFYYLLDEYADPVEE